jgi:AraC-like DNA-binding protein
MSRESPPVRRFTYSSASLEEGVEFLRSRYTDYAPVFSGDLRRFSVKVEANAVDTPVGAFRIDRVRHALGMTLSAEPFEQAAVVANLSGQWSVTCRDGRAESVGIMPYWDRFATATKDNDWLCSMIDVSAVRRVGAELSGLDEAVVAFTGVAPLSRVLGASMTRLMGNVWRDMPVNAGALDSPLLRAETLRHLATVMLLSFPNTALYALNDTSRGGSGTAEPATVRRAMDFMDANAHLGIDLTQIAEAARIGPRALQMAFKRHRGQTPMAYLRRVRMDGAHRDLQAGDPTRGDTVAAIMARWGFHAPRRFYTEYRQLHGCTPVHTLRH